MNRIILIGNGFDLAHKLKTSYNDFINDYWINIINDFQERPNKYINFEIFELTIEKIQYNWQFEGESNYQNLKVNLKNNNSKIIFKNIFLEKISEKRDIQNWVDIEDEYYRLLKDCVKHESSGYPITRLNIDFNRIKELLEKYLTKTINTETVENIDNGQLKRSIGDKIYRYFELKDFTEGIQNEENKLPSVDATYLHKSIPERVLFLNFNYTSIEKYYMNHTEFYPNLEGNQIDIRTLHIHGLLYTQENPIIFGFGDEIGEEYKQIENMNNNEYLKNIKSINYLETSNYKKLLDFISKGEFQLFVFGHSCGISDRTLLNTLFEHKNCCSIKPFYHKINEKEDNYTDIVSNISRNFNDKKAMRDKVVNKEYCEPLS